MNDTGSRPKMLTQIASRSMDVGDPGPIVEHGPALPGPLRFVGRYHVGLATARTAPGRPQGSSTQRLPTGTAGTRTIEALDRQLTAITYDRSGFGDTPSAQRQSSQTDDLLAVLDHVGARALESPHDRLSTAVDTQPFVCRG
jgi:hypothetical protein